MTRIDKLIEDNQGLVFYALNKFFPDRSFDEDLYQIRMIGLWHAAEKYNEDSGVKFSTYATTCIRNEIADELKKERAMKRGMGEEPLSLNTMHGTSEELEYIDSLEDRNPEIDTTDLKNFIKNLEGEERIVVYMKAQGRTFDEIGKKLNLTGQSAKNRWDKIRERIKNECL